LLGIKKYVNMVRYRGSLIVPSSAILDGLDPYDLLTLVSLVDTSIGKYTVIMTKEAGYWPIIIAEIYRKFDMSSAEILTHTEKMCKEYKSTLDTMMSRKETRVLTFNTLEINVIKGFIMSLLGDDYYLLTENPWEKDRSKKQTKSKPEDFYEFMKWTHEKSINSVQSLIQKNLVIDPFSSMGIVVVNQMPQSMNFPTKEGRKRVDSVKKKFWKVQVSDESFIEEEARWKIVYHLEQVNMYKDFMTKMVASLNGTE
jgi:hypothetical protein